MSAEEEMPPPPEDEETPPTPTETYYSAPPTHTPVCCCLFMFALLRGQGEVEDVASLVNLNEETLLAELRVRYGVDKIYVRYWPHRNWTLIVLVRPGLATF